MPIIVTRGPSRERLEEGTRRSTFITTSQGTFSVIPIEKEPDPTVNHKLVSLQRLGHQHKVTWMTLFGDKLVGSYDSLTGAGLLDFLPFSREPIRA